ncbi:right-handed parallel beta-helix repeat-containing protein [Candidatus Sumerlaeota bacterium]|nr:right-handed parallel beta-helix repeat-containing protein [Candidatus Sumerlaeota bacterium]
MMGWSALILFGAGRVWPVPGSGGPLNITVGTTYTVSTISELESAVSEANDAGEPATILIADGVYVLNVPLLHILCDGLIIRSASGNRDAVIIRGPDEGPSATATHTFLIPASNVTIADITFGWCRWHGIQLQGESPSDASGLWVHNCRIVNCNEQFIKGSSSSGDPVGATDGIIENCLFEFTSGWAYQYYTGGIDIHKGVNWIVRDNLFRNIRNPGSGIAEHAVHFWNRCPTQEQNVIVERNWVVNCDRGIGFGLSSYDGGHNGGASAIRDNFVYNDGAGPNTDVGIGLEYADNVQVDNNTVYIATYWAPMEYRFTSNGVIYRNNLVNLAIRDRNDAPLAVMLSNLESVDEAWFVDLTGGDLHLAGAIPQVVDQGASLTEFSLDIDNQRRPEGAAWDIGADELRQPPTNSGSVWLMLD